MAASIEGGLGILRFQKAKFKPAKLTETDIKTFFLDIAKESDETEAGQQKRKHILKLIEKGNNSNSWNRVTSNLQSLILCVHIRPQRVRQKRNNKNGSMCIR